MTKHEEIKSPHDLIAISSEMHDSEFGENDFGYNSEKKEFFLKTLGTNNEFLIKLFNVIKYNPVNLDKIKEKKATAGVFNTVILKNNGRDIVILSQDLQIELRLNKIEGAFSKRNID